MGLAPHDESAAAVTGPLLSLLLWSALLPLIALGGTLVVASLFAAAVSALRRLRPGGVSDHPGIRLLSLSGIERIGGP